MAEDYLTKFLNPYWLSFQKKIELLIFDKTFFHNQ